MRVRTRSAKERQLALAAALKQDPGVEHFSRRAFTVRCNVCYFVTELIQTYEMQMYFIVLVACCCSYSGLAGSYSLLMVFR